MSHGKDYSSGSRGSLDPLSLATFQVFLLNCEDAGKGLQMFGKGYPSDRGLGIRMNNAEENTVVLGRGNTL